MTPYYDHGGITIYHGDCRDILPALDKVDLVLTDPPYGLKENERRVASRGKLANPTDYGPFDWDSEPASEEEIRLTIAAGRNCILWGGNYFHVPPARGWLVWDKQNGKTDFADCEMAWTSLPMATRIKRLSWNGFIKAGELRGKKRLHPAQKPVELMTWCIGFVPSAQTILDPFMGSGSVMLAAKMLGCRGIGIEVEERYCEIAANQMSQEVLPFSDTPSNQEQAEFRQLCAAV